MTLDLSVVMPAYNEAGSISGAVEDVVADVFSAVPNAELVVVDDGSTDATPAIVATLALRDPRIRLVRQANAGHGRALMTGIDAASGAWLLLLDSDRQIGLAEFPAHWDMARSRGLLAVLGERAPRHDPAHRLVISRLMRWLIALRFGQAPRDGGAPYKLLSRSGWDLARPSIAPDCAIPSVILAILLLRQRERVAEVTVQHAARRSGQTVLKWARLVRLCRAAMRDIARVPRGAQN